MSIDERLDRLVERREVLTQTVEHLALREEEQNKRIRPQGDNIRLQGDNIDKVLTALEKIAETSAHWLASRRYMNTGFSDLDGRRDS